MIFALFSPFLVKKLYFSQKVPDTLDIASFTKGNKMTNSIPLVEQIRELTFERTSEDDALNFVPAALELGCTQAEAEDFDEILTTRIMRAAGAI